MLKVRRIINYHSKHSLFLHFYLYRHEKQQEIKRLSNMYPGDAKSQANNFVWDNQSLHSLEVAYKEKYNVYCGPNLQVCTYICRQLSY